MSELEKHFQVFREKTIGRNQKFTTPYGEKEIVYADWIASGRLYEDIEKKIAEDFGPFVGNTHTETSVTGTTMTRAYHEAKDIIKRHVNANEKDVLISAGFGMTRVVNKFQRILGLSVPEQIREFIKLPERERPVVFVTHMEHHSNQTSWEESLADVEIIRPDEQGLPDYDYFADLLEKYKERKIKIGSFSACSNVTGIQPDIRKLSRMIHKAGGVCFVDFAASAPYVDIDMHPSDPLERFDAIFFSPHKFLGGPGASGILIFNSDLYKRKIPDHPGGGTVEWTNPWGEHKYFDDIELREDGGTPGFLQTIRAALAIRLKEKMGTENIEKREKELLNIVWEKLENIPKLHLLANEHRERLGVLSFYVEDVHYNLMVKLLNDRYGIQVRGGCSCAGTYGHYLLHIDPTRSHKITDKINRGDLSEKPGWVRVSLHPTMTDDEVYYILNAIEEIIKNADAWSKDYNYDPTTNEFIHKSFNDETEKLLNDWFTI
jgi:selenocysteine lyase/cysteine desulfurase